MKFSCPFCGQHLEAEDSLVGSFVECPTCGKSFFATDKPQPPSPSPPPLPEEAKSGDDLDEANVFLERMIGNVAHAILGIFRRIWQVFRYFLRGIKNAVRWFFDRVVSFIQFFFSIRFAKFVVLLGVLLFLLAVLGGIVIAPAVISLWVCRTQQNAPESLVDEKWNWLSNPSTAASNVAFWVEVIWLILFAGWGIWIGIKSYKRGVIARWRARRKEKRAARRAAREAARNTDPEER